MLNAGITPVVHEFGSLGCSGDLAPLAHCALAAMGEGTVHVNGASTQNRVGCGGGHKRLAAPHYGVMNEIAIGVEALTEQQVLAVARRGARVRLSDEAREAIAREPRHHRGAGRRPEPHYGISTGFGALATTHIARPTARPAAAQPHPLARGRHRAGGRARGGPGADAAPPLDPGHRPHRRAPGGRETYAALLNAGITPVVREYGSLGCSGDLAPLAHCALARWARATCASAGEALAAADALAAAGITPVVLREKEGLALINGTDGMLGMLLLALTTSPCCCRTADSPPR